MLRAALESGALFITRSVIDGLLSAEVHIQPFCVAILTPVWFSYCTRRDNSMFPISLSPPVNKSGTMCTYPGVFVHR